MALDNFRAIKVRLDSQGDYIPDGVTIKQGDVNGRLFQLYITDYGTPISMDGVSAIFGYRRPDGVSDMVDFKTVGDHLEVAVPEKAGQVVGDVTVELQVKGVDFIVGSRNFTLKCESSPASFSGIVNSNSYKDLLKIPDAMLALESDANQIKTNAESTLKAQSERGEKIIQENEKAFTDAHADFESRYVAAEKTRDGKYETAEAERDRKFNVAQSGRVSDYSSWKSTIASDAESRIQAKEQLFDNSLSTATSKLDGLSTQYTNSLRDHENSWNTQQQAAKTTSDNRIKKLDTIIAAYEGETPLTSAIADSKYQPKGDYATKSDLETLADSEALSSLATKEELKSYIKNEASSVKTTNLADGSVTPDKLSETYLKSSEAESKYATKSTATTSSDGLMSTSDKSKLDGIEAGAQRNTVTSVNGKTGVVTIPTVDLSPYVTKTDAQQTYQPKGNYQAAGSYVTTSKHTSDLALKQDKGSYVESTDILKIKVVDSIPSSGEPNTLYLVKEN